MQGESERADAMDRETFLKRVNMQAAARYGVSEITLNVLNDWLEAKIITAPDKHGHVRDWGPKEYRRALEIVRLKYQGAAELREIRFHLWAKGLNVAFFGRSIERSKMPIARICRIAKWADKICPFDISTCQKSRPKCLACEIRHPKYGRIGLVSCQIRAI